MKEEVYSYTINSEYKLPRSELTNVFAVSQRCSGDFNNASLIGKKVTLTSKTYVNSITASLLIVSLHFERYNVKLHSFMTIVGLLERFA